MGGSNALQDAWASETPGPIHDRSREHLGTSDTHIVAARRAFLAGVAVVAAGRTPIHVIRDAAQDDMSHIVVVSEVIPLGADHRELWRRKIWEHAAIRAAGAAAEAADGAETQAEPRPPRKLVAGGKG
jgi:hypothetical protein